MGIFVSTTWRDMGGGPVGQSLRWSGSASTAKSDVMMHGVQGGTVRDRDALHAAQAAEILGPGLQPVGKGRCHVVDENAPDHGMPGGPPHWTITVPSGPHRGAVAPPLPPLFFCHAHTNHTSRDRHTSTITDSNRHHASLIFGRWLTAWPVSLGVERSFFSELSFFADSLEFRGP